jgi:hypothetical protein
MGAPPDWSGPPSCFSVFALALLSLATAQTNPGGDWTLVECVEGGYTAMTTGTTKVGFTTFWLTVQPKPGSRVATNVYAIFGEAGKLALDVPRAYHVTSHFGADIGGVNPALFIVEKDAEIDSWLTIGLTKGNDNNEMSSIGINWSDWTVDADLRVHDGAVFFMNPE